MTTGAAPPAGRARGPAAQPGVTAKNPQGRPDWDLSETGRVLGLVPDAVTFGFYGGGSYRHVPATLREHRRPRSSCSIPPANPVLSP